MVYVPNNIRFRSVSAKVIAHFYSNKAYILNELLMERNQFSEVARETLLLLFNSYSEWATRIEYLFLNNCILTRKEIDSALAEEDRVQSYHLEVFENYADKFQPQFIEAWYGINVHTRNAFRTIIQGTEGLSHLEAYPIIIAGLSASLQNCLYELYEIDCLFGSDFVQEQVSTNKSNADRMVVYVDNYALEYFFKTGIFMCEERIKYYSSLVQGRLPTLVKNYSTSAVTYAGVIEGDEPLATLLKRCAEIVDIIDIVSDTASLKT